MRNPTAIFAWSTWRQHGNVIIVAIACMVVSIGASGLLWLRSVPESLTPWAGFFQLISVVAAIALSLLSVLAYADLHMDLLSRESGFPRPLLRLPVRTSSLIIWPIGFGLVVPVILMLLVATVIVPAWKDFGRDFPIWWPAAIAAAAVAWLQALIWLPFGLPGLRLAVLAAVYAGMIRFAIYSSTNRLDEWKRVTAFAGMTVAAWCVSYWAVRWARYGVAPDWSWIFRPVASLRFWSGSSGRDFRSAARASNWLAWRLSGRAVAFATAVVLAMILGASFLTSLDAHWVPAIVSYSMFTPPIVAGLAGGWSLGGRTRAAKHILALSPWLASMPVSDDDRVRTALRNATRSTLAAYGMVALAFAVVAIRFALTPRLRGDLSVLVDSIAGTQALMSTMIATALTLMIWTWKRTLNSYLVGHFGRTWIGVEIGIWFCVYLSLIFVATALDAVRIRPDFFIEFLLGLLFAVRLLLAGLAIFAAIDRGYLSIRSAIVGVAIWLTLLGGVLWTFGLAGRAGDRQQWTTLLLVAAAFPVVRLAAAPFLVRLSRHR